MLKLILHTLIIPAALSILITALNLMYMKIPVKDLYGQYSKYQSHRQQAMLKRIAKI